MSKNKYKNQILITDLDNTLYNWVDAFAPAFRVMVHVISKVTKLDENNLIESFKQVYSKHKTLQYTFPIQELPILKELNIDSDYLIEKIIKPARTAFYRTRKKHLKLYPHVKETLHWVKNQGLIVIGLSDARLYQAERRLKNLNIDKFFDYLICKENVEMSEDDLKKITETRSFGKSSTLKQIDFFEFENSIYHFEHKKFEYGKNLEKPSSNIQEKVELDKSNLKPSPKIFELITTRYQTTPEYVYVVGDSLTKDILFAQNIGAHDIWAKYGEIVDKKNLETMNRITYWSKNDKSDNTKENMNIIPTYIIDNFSEIRYIIKPNQLNLI